MSQPTEELDRLTDRDAAASLQHEFPGWTCYRAADRLCYGRHSKEAQRHLVRGEDWVDLRDEIIRAIWRPK